MSQPDALPDLLHYSWNGLERDLVNVKDKLNFEIDCIVAIAPRGLVLATILSYRLNLPLFVLDPERVLGFDIPQLNILLVDALADNEFNKTCFNVRKLRSFIINTLVIHEQEPFIADVVLSTTLPHNSWINYPWEQYNVRQC